MCIEQWACNTIIISTYLNYPIECTYAWTIFQSLRFMAKSMHLHFCMTSPIVRPIELRTCAFHRDSYIIFFSKNENIRINRIRIVWKNYYWHRDRHHHHRACKTARLYTRTNSQPAFRPNTTGVKALDVFGNSRKIQKTKNKKWNASTTKKTQNRQQHSTRR